MKYYDEDGVEVDNFDILFDFTDKQLLEEVKFRGLDKNFDFYEVFQELVQELDNPDKSHRDVLVSRIQKIMGN